MRMASWRWGGVAHAGTVSPCGREVMPLALPQPQRGARRLTQMLARGGPLPRVTGPLPPLESVSLCAPLPRPLGSLFCAGRNYRAHGAELAATVFRDSLPESSSSQAAWPIVFADFADCVVGPFDAVKMPGAPLIETCSRGITLHPGDVIATGTPAGVGMGMGFTPPRCLQGGRQGADRDRWPRRRREPVSVLSAAGPFRRRALPLGRTAPSAWGAA